MLNRILKRGEANGNLTEPTVVNPVEVVSAGGWVPPSSLGDNLSGVPSVFIFSLSIWIIFLEPVPHILVAHDP